MKKAFKWIGLILLSPILLFLLITILLYVPPVQKLVVDFAASQASEQMGMDVTIGRLRVAFPLDVVVEDVNVANKGESVLHVKSITADVELWPLIAKKTINIDAIDMDSAAVNSQTLIDQCVVNGRVGHFHMESHGIELTPQTVMLSVARIDDSDITISLPDSVPPDTTVSEPVMWKIRLGEAEINRMKLRINMPPKDSMWIAANIGQAKAENGYIDLGNEIYKMESVDCRNSSASCDMGSPVPPKGNDFDYSHIAVSKVGVNFRNIEYKGNGDFAMAIVSATLRERCGLQVDELSGKVEMDSLSMRLRDMALKTPASNARLRLDYDFSALTPGKGGKIVARAFAQIGKSDVMCFASMMPHAFAKNYPAEPLTLNFALNGNVDEMDFTGLQMGMKRHFWLKADGKLRHLFDDKRRGADVKFDATADDMGFVTAMLPANVMKDYALPRMTANGRVTADGNHYGVDACLTEGKSGVVKMTAKYDAGTDAYEADIDANGVQMRDFMPHDSFGALTARVSLKGRGTDPYSAKTSVDVDGEVSKFSMGKYRLDNMQLVANYVANRYKLLFRSDNDLLVARANAEGIFTRKRITTVADIDLDRADMQQMRLSDQTFDVSMKASFSGVTDLANLYSLRGKVTRLGVVTPSLIITPENIDMLVEANPDTIYANVNAGDLFINFSSGSGVMELADKGMELYRQLMNQIERREIDERQLMQYLPRMALHIESGCNNPVAEVMSTQSLAYDEVFADFKVSPETGINGHSYIYSLVYDSTRLDTIRLALYQDTTALKFDAEVRNNSRNKQFVFDFLANGKVHKNGADMMLTLFDERGRKGVEMGADVSVTDSGYYCHLFPDRPLVAYRKFNLNPDNFLLIGKNNHVTADITLLTDDGMGVSLYSTPNSNALQDLTATFARFDLKDITSVIPYAPRMTGMLNGDARLLQTEENISVMSDMSVTALTYEGCPLGNISTEFVYLPKEGDSHHVNGRILKDDIEVCTIDGTYLNKGEGYLDATLGLARCPLSLVNGFIPDQLCALRGYADGTMSVRGALSTPDVNGSVTLDSASIYSDYYGINLKLDNQPLVVDHSNIVFSNYNIHSFGKNPLTVNGNVNFSNLDRIYTNLRMRAQNFELINNRFSRKSILYGKVNVNFAAFLRGYMDDMLMRGKLDVLGSTNVTYVLKDTPLTVEDRLTGLVNFTDFANTEVDTTEVKETNFSLEMLMTINVADGAQFNCDLSPDRSSYITLEGGGTLTMEYTPQGTLSLAGRYTLNNGEMKYALPVIPLKTFTIQNGSYVEFTGDPMNPALNITASERVKSSVTIDDNPTTVNFDVGVAISNTLEQLGLSFTLAAPENMTIQNELATMTPEERGKLAVTMLCTGMYLSESNSSGFTMSNALNAFLQSEINNIAGSALKSVDLSVDMADGTTSTGASTTDFSFKFAKRFWGNRLSVIIGGKVSTGAEAQQDNQTFIDNISLEWRLDESASRYVKLFYDKNYASILEGEITEMGAGIVLRKKVTKLGELFVFGKKKAASDFTPRERPANATESANVTTKPEKLRNE